LHAIAVDQTDTLTIQDRCDICGAQAYIQVKGVSGELLFCGHDYESIMNNSSGKEKLESFAFEVVDERYKLDENRLIGED
jgi:hypothetical protein